MFVNFPRWTEDAPVSVAEVMKDGSLKPYPDDEWNAWRNANAAAGTMKPVDHFVCVQSVVCDGRGNLWVLDPAAPGLDKVLPGSAKLVRIELATNKVAQVIKFGEDVALQGSYLNDVRFHPDGRTAFITDSGARGSIVVVDLEKGTAHSRLDGHPSTQPDKTVEVTIDGKKLQRPDGRGFMVASDGIALSRDGKTLYWQPLTGRTLYRIGTDLLMSDDVEAVGKKVEKAGTSCVADGLINEPRRPSLPHLARRQFGQAVGGQPRPRARFGSPPAPAGFDGRGAGRLDLRHRLAHPGQRLVQQGCSGRPAHQAVQDGEVLARLRLRPTRHGGFPPRSSLSSLYER